MLPQMETNEERIRQRQIETERKRGIYQWKCEPDLPSYMRTKFADLPVSTSTRSCYTKYKKPLP